MKYAVSYSFGKDSYLSVLKMIEKYGLKPSAFIVSMKDEKTSWTHKVDIETIKNLEKSTGIRIYPVVCRLGSYEEDFTNGLIGMKEELGIESIVYGDIFIEKHIEWNKKRAEEAGLEPVHPLSDMTGEEVIDYFFENNVRALVVKVDESLEKLDIKGKFLDRNIIDIIRKTGADVCGENGEYHTLVTEVSFK